MSMRLVAGVSLAALVAATSAQAETAAVPTVPQQEPLVPAPPASNGGQRVATLDAAYFAQFAPRTALDMVQRVPGFSLDLGSTQTEIGSVDVRGFAGVAGNVVINGARPSTKAETLETLLARIPAQRVVRVELGPGDLFGSDYAGKSQVANVILATSAGIDANVTASGRRLFTGYIDRDISGSALIRRGASTFNLSARTGRNTQIDEGTDALTLTGDGTLFERRRKVNSYFNRDPSLSASWAMERASDSAFRANAQWTPSKFNLEQKNRVTSSQGQERDDSLIQRYRNPVIEVGGDVTQPLAGGALKLVALATRRKRDDMDAYIERDGLLADGAAVVGGFEQTVEARRNETIGRLSWSRGELFGLSFEVGAEAAYNTLDSAVEFFSISEGGERTRIDLPIDEATVKEKRGELYVALGKSLSSSLRLDGGVNYEFSTLEVRGDATADRALRFLKPNLALDWKPAGDWHARLSVKRSVAQLNFYDFISFAELANDRVTGGNAELLPQRTWEVRTTVDHPILGDGLVKLDLGLDRVSKLQDQILTPEGFSAPGNLGTGRRTFARLTIDAPLARLGLSGITLKAEGQVQRTRVHDPISGDERDFSGFYPRWEWSVEGRRDAGRFSYGLEVSDRAPFTFFRANEIDRSYNGGPFGELFVEYRPTARTAITLQLENLFNTKAYRERLFFSPNRSIAEPGQRELRERNRHVTFGISVKQTLGFGGVAEPN